MSTQETFISLRRPMYTFKWWLFLNKAKTATDIEVVVYNIAIDEKNRGILELDIELKRSLDGKPLSIMYNKEVFLEFEKMSIKNYFTHLKGEDVHEQN